MLIVDNATIIYSQQNYEKTKNIFAVFIFLKFLYC